MELGRRIIAVVEWIPDKLLTRLQKYLTVEFFSNWFTTVLFHQDREISKECTDIVAKKMSNDWMSKWPPQEVQSSVAYLNAAKHTVNFWVVLILKKKSKKSNDTFFSRLHNKMIWFCKNIFKTLYFSLIHCLLKWKLNSGKSYFLSSWNADIRISRWPAAPSDQKWK